MYTNGILIFYTLALIFVFTFLGLGLVGFKVNVRNFEPLISSNLLFLRCG